MRIVAVAIAIAIGMFFALSETAMAQEPAIEFTLPTENYIGGYHTVTPELINVEGVNSFYGVIRITGAITISQGNIFTYNEDWDVSYRQYEEGVFFVAGYGLTKSTVPFSFQVTFVEVGEGGVEVSMQSGTQYLTAYKSTVTNPARVAGMIEWGYEYGKPFDQGGVLVLSIKNKYTLTQQISSNQFEFNNMVTPGWGTLQLSSPANGGEAVTAYDASLILRHFLGSEYIYDSSRVAAMDANGNGWADPDDAYQALRRAVGLSSACRDELVAREWVGLYGYALEYRTLRVWYHCDASGNWRPNGQTMSRNVMLPNIRFEGGALLINLNGSASSVTIKSSTPMQIGKLEQATSILSEDRLSFAGYWMEERSEFRIPISFSNSEVQLQVMVDEEGFVPYSLTAEPVQNTLFFPAVNR